MLKNSLLMTAFTVSTLLISINSAYADSALERISSRKTLSVCTATDLKPFGFTDSTGKVSGYNIDIIEKIHSTLESKLGVPLKLNLVSTIPANRIEFLSRGKCDITVTSMNITPERKKVVDFVEPGFFYSGANILARKDNNISNWEDLKGKKICSLQGSSWNSQLERRYGMDILAFGGVAEAGQALQDGRCEGWLSDDAYLTTRLGEATWADYNLKMKTDLGSPWGVALAFGNNELKTILSAQIKTFHADGTLIELAKKWQLTDNTYLEEQHKLAKQ